MLNILVLVQYSARSVQFLVSPAYDTSRSLPVCLATLHHVAGNADCRTDAVRQDLCRSANSRVDHRFDPRGYRKGRKGSGLIDSSLNQRDLTDLTPFHPPFSSPPLDSGNREI